MPARNLYVIFFLMTVSTFCYFKSERTRYASPVGDAIFLIDRFYVDPIDQRDLLEGAMQGVVGQLDPYSSFINPQSYNHFQDALQQRFAGIGIIVEKPEGVDRVRVVTPLYATPAFKAGLHPGDVIMKVDGTDIKGMAIGDVSNMLRGPEGTSVLLQLKRGADESIEVRVTRAWIPLESVLGDHRDENNDWVYRLRDYQNIAFVRVTTFGEQTVEEVTKVLEELDNDFDSLIVDLRQNQGGLLTAAIDICDMFLDEGVIVTTKGRGGVKESEAVATKGMLIEPNKRVVVLIDGDSASASEIVAACLKDHKRAIVCGERSFGKGTVQNVLPLESGRSALKLTTARYYRPNDKNIHRQEGFTEDDVWGVKPTENFEVKLTDEQRIAAIKRLQRAAYPIIPDAEPKGESSDAVQTEVDSSDNETSEKSSKSQDANENKVIDPDSIEQDPQLLRAIEYLLEKPAQAEKIAA